VPGFVGDLFCHVYGVDLTRFARQLLRTLCDRSGRDAADSMPADYWFNDAITMIPLRFWREV
jgi:hypothetical protein